VFPGASSVLEQADLLEEVVSGESDSRETQVGKFVSGREIPNTEQLGEWRSRIQAVLSCPGITQDSKARVLEGIARRVVVAPHYSMMAEVMLLCLAPLCSWAGMVSFINLRDKRGPLEWDVLDQRSGSGKLRVLVSVEARHC
jgi:hypothetical protein